MRAGVGSGPFLERRVLARLSQQPLAKWQGSYYSFNDVQVRVFEDEDELWFAAKDVLAAVGMRGIPDSFLAIYPDGSRMIPGTRLTALNAKALATLTARYRNDAQLVGKVYRKPPGWAADWVLSQDGAPRCCLPGPTPAR